MRASAAGLLLLLLLGCGQETPTPAPWSERPQQPLALVVTVEQKEAALLAVVQLRFDLWYERGLEPKCEQKAPPGFALGPLADAERSVELHGGQWRSWTRPLRATRAGELTITPFLAKATLKDGREVMAESKALPFTSKALLPDEKGAVEAPADLFAPEPYWARHPWRIVATLVLFAAAVTCWLWLRKKRRPAATAEATETALPAHTKALRALARLRNEPRISAEQIERFYVGIAQVLRVYLEERFGLHAPERTTEEFLLEAQGSTVLDAAQTLELRAFLQSCDLVKFAKKVPGDAEHLTVFAVAERFVEATRPDRAAQPLAAVAGGAR